MAQGRRTGKALSNRSETRWLACKIIQEGRLTIRETFPSWCTDGNIFILIFGSALAIWYEVGAILQYRKWARPLY